MGPRGLKTRRMSKLDVNLFLNCCLQLLLWLQPKLESTVFMQSLCLPLENCSFVHVNNVGAWHAHSFPGLISSPCIFVRLSSAMGKENHDKSGGGWISMSRRWTSKGLIWIFLQSSLITNWALYPLEACPRGRLPRGVQWLKGKTLAPWPPSLQLSRYWHISKAGF